MHLNKWQVREGKGTLFKGVYHIARDYGTPIEHPAYFIARLYNTVELLLTPYQPEYIVTLSTYVS